LTQAADKSKTARQSGGKLRFGFRGLNGKARAVARTELNVIGVCLLASVANLHKRQYNSPVARILAEMLLQNRAWCGRP
jgi:hypothetical protein